MPAFTTFPAPVAAFLDQPLLATATTLNRDGSPQLSYIFFMREGNEIAFSTTSDRVKTKNLLRDPRINFAVVDPANAFKWVIVNGTATVTTEGAFEFLAKAVGRRMTPDQTREYVDRLRSEPRVVVRITPKTMRVSGFE